MTTEPSPRSIPADLAVPRFFLKLALCLAILFLLAHLAGWREHTSFLSGTAAAAGTDLQTSAYCGVIYILVYLGFVVAAPVLLLASGILWLWRNK